MAPIGWPSEMPLPLGLVRSGGSSSCRHHRQRLGRERLVDLEHVDVLQVQAGLLEQRLHRRHRADAHVLRVDAGVAVAHQPAQRLQPALLGQAALHQHHRRRRVVDAGGVAGGHGAVRVEHRLEPGQLLHRAVAAHRLVDLERHRAALDLDLDRHDLPLEVALVDGVGGPAVALGGELVLVLARDLVLLGDVLGGDAHVAVVERVAQGADHHVGQGRVVHAAPQRMAGAR